MNIKFTKLIVPNRFNNSFENWNVNNEIEFSDCGFTDIYAPNGVGKSSLAKALKNEIKSEYTYEYNGIIYTEKSKDNPIAIIDDFFFRNIASREKEKISDYILGSQINKELELREKIENAVTNIKGKMITYLKDEYGIKTKNNNLCNFIDNDNFKNFISALANNRDKGKEYNAEKILKLVNEIDSNIESVSKDEKFNYIKNNLENVDSIIKTIVEFDTSNFNKISGFKKIDIDNDAIKILEKHKDITTCIFEETHRLPDNIKEQLEKNKETIVNQLTSKQKEITDKILELDNNNPLHIKDIFNSAFEKGEIEEIEKLIEEIKLTIFQIQNEISKYIIKLIQENKLKELYWELKELLDKKVELAEEDEILLKNIIENCLNKEVKIERDSNKNIIFKLNNTDIIGKSRQELPLSTGEQNFISLYFELLAAKNSKKDIIIIDDPISSFDSIYKNKIIYAIIKVLEKKNTIILTHNINTIKLMQHQYKDCFNLYLLNNEKNEENGFIKIDRRANNSENYKDLDLMLEIKNVIQLFREKSFIDNVKNKEQFLLSLIPFMRSYFNLLPQQEVSYKKLCKLMHGYENQSVDINFEYQVCFGERVMENSYNVTINDILNTEIDDEIVDKEKYPILNRTLYHTLNYLKLRLMVENTLYNTDTNKLDTSKNYQLHQIINIYLENNYALKTNLISKKTLLNEFNHFEYDMCLFMPSLDISNNKLNEEKNSIIKVCDEIRTNGI